MGPVREPPHEQPARTVRGHRADGPSLHGHTAPATPDRALATVLRRLRNERGETQPQLAYRAGLTTASLANIELGRSSPAWLTVRRIAWALDVSMADLSAAVEREPDE